MMAPHRIEVMTALTVGVICWASLRLAGVENPGVYFLTSFIASTIERRTR